MPRAKATPKKVGRGYNMSEPSSLYMRITLTPQAFAAFCQSRPVAPRFYQDWQSWLATQTFYGEITDERIAQLPAAEVTSLGEYLTYLAKDMDAGPAKTVYDPVTKRCTLAVPQLSENYIDFIEVLTLLRGVAHYKDLPGEDFILIYPHFWGGAPEAYLVITEGSSQFVAPTPDTAIHEASQFLEKLYEEIVGPNGEEL